MLRAKPKISAFHVWCVRSGLMIIKSCSGWQLLEVLSHCLGAVDPCFISSFATNACEMGSVARGARLFTMQVIGNDRPATTLQR